MSKAFGLRDLGGPAEAAARAVTPGIRGRRGLRLALLSLAAVILLLGAAIAGVFCYQNIGHGFTSGGSAGAGAEVGARIPALPRLS